MGELTYKSESKDEPQPPPVPGGGLGARHIQILLYFLGMVVGYALRVIISVAIVAMTKSDTNPDFTVYNWSTHQQGLIKSTFFWGYAAMQIPSGYIAGVWSARYLLSSGIFICSLAAIGVPLLVDQGGWQLFCGLRILMGLSQACLLPSVQTLLARWVPPGERARLGTFAYAGAQVGTVVTMPISGWLAGSEFGWPSIFYVFGALGVGWSILFLFLGSDSPAQHRSISQAEKVYIEHSLNVGENKSKPKIPWMNIMTSAPMWALIIAHCGQNWGFWLLLTEIPTFMSKIIGFKIEENGLISALPYLAMWLLSFPASWLSDYALRRGVSRGCIRKTSNSIAHWGPAIALIALCYVRNTELAITLLVVAVALNAGSLCGFQINHIDLSPNFAGTMMSITNCLAGIVAIVAPIVNGDIISDQSNINQWHTMFYITAAVYFVGNLIFVIFGSGELQWWNEPTAPRVNNDHDKRSYNIPTISGAYDQYNVNSAYHKSVETT